MTSPTDANIDDSAATTRHCRVALTTSVCAGCSVRRTDGRTDGQACPVAATPVLGSDGRRNQHARVEPDVMGTRPSRAGPGRAVSVSRQAAAAAAAAARTGAPFSYITDIIARG